LFVAYEPKLPAVAISTGTPNVLSNSTGLLLLAATFVGPNAGQDSDAVDRRPRILLGRELLLGRCAWLPVARKSMKKW